jgi:hypothetical protein
MTVAAALKPVRNKVESRFRSDRGHLLHGMIDFDRFFALFADKGIDRIKPSKGEEGAAVRTRGAGDAVRVGYAILVRAARNLAGRTSPMAHLDNANLLAANLSGSKLELACLDGAELGSTIFSDVDLTHTHCLDSVRHLGPSSIGIDTMFRSNGRIPESFLRGAGVPEAFIKYAKSLIGSAIEFYSCFISYSTKDQEFADRLYADLQAKGVRCWFAPHDVQGGRKLHEQIDEAIRFHDKLLLILSPNSMASEWVQTEISKARKREISDKARVLFPISLAPYQNIRDWEAFDADSGKDSAREIREYFIPDFSNWKDDDCYHKAFERLVNDLKAPPEKSGMTSSGA